MLSVLGGIFVWVTQSRGGIVAHIASFGQGRFEALGDITFLVVPVTFAPLVLAIWYVFDRRVVKQPWFLALLGGVLAAQFIINGSRSATVMPLTLLVAIWIYHERRLPKAAILGVAVMGILAIGVLGNIRKSTFGTEPDFSTLTEFDVGNSIDAAAADVAERNRNSAFLPTIARVPGEVDYLWGRSYVVAFTFFIPRSIWPGKPRGIGSYVKAIIFGAAVTDPDAYRGSSVPPGAVAEAFWNFGVSGVIVVFLLFGIFLRWMAAFFLAYSTNGAVVAFYLISLNLLTQPTSTQLNPYFQAISLVLPLFIFLGVLRLGPQKGVPRSTRSSGVTRALPRTQ